MNITTYYEWVRLEAHRLGSDGCSAVAEFNQDCCFEHDLAYRTGKDPRVAFTAGWELAPPITRREADKRFRECNQHESIFGVCSPLAWWRWLGVRIGGRRGWSHA